MARPVAVIGSNGFLGRATVRALRREGIPVQEYTRERSFLDQHGRLDGNLERVGSVVWVASSTTPSLAEEHVDLVDQDREAMDSLIAGLQRLGAPPRVVNVSSGGTVYDPSAPPPYAETSPTDPSGAYGRAKLMLERTLTDSGLPGVSLRVSNAYGPGQTPKPGQGVIAHWLSAALTGRSLHIFGDDGAERDYVFVDDVAAAIIAACAAESVPPVVNVGSGHPTSLRQLAEIVLAVVDDPAVEITHVPGRTFDLARTWLDITLAREVLGWKPRTTLPAGVAKAAAAFRPADDRS